MLPSQSSIISIFAVKNYRDLDPLDAQSLLPVPGCCFAGDFFVTVLRYTTGRSQTRFSIMVTYLAASISNESVINSLRRGSGDLHVGAALLWYFCPAR